MNLGSGGYSSVNTFGSNYGSTGGGYGSTGGGYSSGGGYGGGVGGGYGLETGGGYGGGGFMASQSPSVDKKRVGRVQSIRPLTSAQIQQATQQTADDTFRIDNEEVGQVVVVGEIVEVIESQTNISYKIDDRTGPLIEVRRWINEEDTQAELQKRAACREGIYVKITGHLRSFNKQRNMVAFNIEPIQNFSEVTRHLVEVVYAHLISTKGAPVPAEFSSMQQVKSESAGSSGWTPIASSTQMGTGNVYMGGGRIDSGLNHIQKQVLSIISQSRTEHGINVRDVIAVARQHGFSDQNIRGAVDFLCNEGHIYSTIDDEHFRSTEEV